MVSASMSHRDGRLRADTLSSRSGELADPGRTGPARGGTVHPVAIITDVPQAVTAPVDPPTADDLDEDELVRLSSLGHPDDPIPSDAVPLWDVEDNGPLLPAWYMPAPAAGVPLLRGWRRVVAWLIVTAFLAIVSAGLCSTYGEIVIA